MRRSFINMHAMSSIKFCIVSRKTFDCTQWSHLSGHIKSWKWNFQKLVNQQINLVCVSVGMILSGDRKIKPTACGSRKTFPGQLSPLRLIWCSWIWNQSPCICNILLTNLLSLLNLSLLLQNILDRAFKYFKQCKKFDIVCTEQRRQSYLPSGMNMQ